MSVLKLSGIQRRLWINCNYSSLRIMIFDDFTIFQAVCILNFEAREVQT